MLPLKFLTHPAIAKHTSTVIFVHGLGDTGHGWLPVAQMFGQDAALSQVKWVLPHAPTRKVTANLGMEMPSWFDIYSFGFDSTEDEEGIMQSVDQLNALVQAEVDNGIDPSRIVLGGFSQGGAMSLLTGLSSKYKLGGVVVLSGWLPLREKFGSLLSPHAKSIPIFWGHGTADPLVKYPFGFASAEYLTGSLGIPKADAEGYTGLNFNSYAGVVHSTSPKELDDLRAWLRGVLPAE